MSVVQSLTLYAVRSSHDGSVETFDDLIDPDRLEDAETRDFDGIDEDGRDWSARLYLWPGEERPPTWLAFLQEGFGADLTVPDTSQTRVVVAINVFFRRERFFVLTFGAGRYQLRSGVTESRWGLRAALNAIYGAGSDAAAETLDRIQQVQTRTVAANTFRTLRQANRGADFDSFGYDAYADQLNAIVGRVHDRHALGTRVKGADSLRLARRSSFAELGSLCRGLASLHERKNYLHRFQFIDNYRRIVDPELIATLEDLTVESLSERPDVWTLAPPDLIDFDRVDRYRIQLPGVDAFEGADPTLEEIVQTLAATQVEVSPALLRDGRITALDAEGNASSAWSLSQVLDGQIAHSGRTIVMEAGEYFEIAPDYLAQLDSDIDGIDESAVELPDSVREPEDGELKEIVEGRYNELAAGHRASHLLLDKKTITIPGKTSPIEICDVLTLSPALVHVKRKFASSSLSHLFAQGYVSSELLVGSRDFRIAVLDKIGPNEPAFRDLFDREHFLASEFEVVYAIVGDWQGKQLRNLPFFSKVNLRKHASGLRRMGFRVTHAKVRVVDPE